MGNPLEAIFGGGDQTTTQTNIPWEPLQPYILDSMQGISDQLGTREYFPGDTVADLNDQQLQAIQMMMGAGDQIGDLAGNLGQTMGTYMDPSFMDPNANPYQSQYVDAALRPIEQRYSEQVMPGIRSNVRMTGGSDYGSTRQGIAEGIATRGYLDTVGDVTARINTDLYGKNIDAQQRALSLIHISEPTRPPSTSRMPSSA